jgi:hypothetical protein
MSMKNRLQVLLFTLLQSRESIPSNTRRRNALKVRYA